MTGEPLHPDEIVYRRIVFDHLSNPKYEPHPAYGAFIPHKNDNTGVSLSRAKYKTIEEAAIGWPGKRYHVAKMLVHDLMAIGLTVIADDPGGDSSHAIIPELRRGAYETNKESCQEIAKQIVSSIAEIVLVALDPAEYPDLPHTPTRNP